MIKWLIGLFLLWLVLDGCVADDKRDCVTFLTPQLRAITVKRDRVAGNVTFDNGSVSTTIDGTFYLSTVYSYGTCTGGGK